MKLPTGAGTFFLLMIALLFAALLAWGGVESWKEGGIGIFGAIFLWVLAFVVAAGQGLPLLRDLRVERM